MLSIASSPSNSLPHPRKVRLSALALIAVAGLAGPASAQSTLLHGAVGTSYVPTFQQNWPNVAVASLQDMVAHDAVGNDGIANGTLNTLTGRIILSPHACSGGGPGFGGQAVGSTSASVVLDYSIVSATLPAGTPVSVKVNWALFSRVVAVGEDMIGSNTSASASAAVHLTLAPNYTVQTNRQGSISRTVNTSGEQKITSGTMNVESDSAHYTFPMQVGQVIRVSISCDVGANSSVEAGMTDGDAQLAAVWGVTPEDGAASAVLLSNPNQPAPAWSSATPADAQQALPPRPVYLMPCFQFTLQPEAVSICGPTNAGFSVAASGSGPFTYQWRKDGVPIDLQTNPSAQSATLSLPNASTGDAGSYDVVVYNPCGSLTSNAATLSVCPVSASGTTTGTRLAPARPAPFRASTTLAFDLAAAGEATLDVFDVRGAHVRTLASGWHEAGRSEAVWHGDDDAGRRVPAGVYLVRLATKGFLGTQRIVRMP